MRHPSTFENYNYYPKQNFLKSKIVQSITKKHVAYRNIYYKLSRKKKKKQTLLGHIIQQNMIQIQNEKTKLHQNPKSSL